MKTCTLCGTEKEDVNFSVIRRHEDGSVKYRNSWCNECKKKRHNEKHGITARKGKYSDETSKECTRCNEIKEHSCFSVSKRNEDGSAKHTNSWCKPCVLDSQHEKLGRAVKYVPIVNEDSKECYTCRIVKHISEFSPAERGRLGRASDCKECTNSKLDRGDEAREKRRLQTIKHRKDNLFAWRAKHRLHQYNRRAKIKATDDKTLTPEVLDFIYRIVHCYWCKKEIDPSERTLEHVQELSAGGIHGISNVRMACISCNSARKGKQNGRS